MSVPKLRFKNENGQDFPDWEEKTFSQTNIRVIDGDRGENYPNGSDFSGEGYCLFLNAKNVTKSGFLFNEVSFITKQKDEVLRKGKLIRNDIIITTRGTVGNIAYYDENIKYENMRINSGMVIIRNDSANIDPNYLYKYFYSPRFRKTLEQIAFGSAQPQLTVAEINKFKIGIPILEEQTKIADFLITIDEKIAQLTQKCELLARYKKGVMQQLFSQELRFKDDDGRDFPDWEDKQFKDIFTIKYGKDYKHLNSGNIPVIGTGGIMTYVDQFLYDKPSVLIGRKGTIDKPQFIEKPFWTVDTLFYTEINKGFCPFFVYLLALQINWYKFNEATGVPSLNTTAINNIDVFIPSSFQEQTKIANFLTAIDEKIAQSQTYLETVKQYKQGLLQQMFI